MMDFDERGPCSSNMYLPSCTYYVSGPDFSSLPSFLPQTPSSRPMTYSYSSNLPQVQPVREVTFREYAIEPATKWHPRGNLAHCYSAEELVHRDCLQAPSAAGVPGDVLAKSSANVYHHPTPAVSSNFYSTVGRNGVLPQAFDQFFETAYGTPENLASSDYPGDKSAEKGPPAAAATSAAAAAAAAARPPEPRAGASAAAAPRGRQRREATGDRRSGRCAIHGPPSEPCRRRGSGGGGGADSWGRGGHPPAPGPPAPRSPRWWPSGRSGGRRGPSLGANLPAPPAPSPRPRPLPSPCPKRHSPAPGAAPPVAAERGVGADGGRERAAAAAAPGGALMRRLDLCCSTWGASAEWALRDAAPEGALGTRGGRALLLPRPGDPRAVPERR